MKAKALFMTAAAAALLALPTAAAAQDYPPVPEDPDPPAPAAPDTTSDTGSLPRTGGGLVLGAAGALAGAAILRRRGA